MWRGIGPEKERERRVITAFCGGMVREEGGEEVDGGVRGAINFVTDEGHRGAEVLQGSWELFFK